MVRKNLREAAKKKTNLGRLKVLVSCKSGLNYEKSGKEECKAEQKQIVRGYMQTIQNHTEYVEKKHDSKGQIAYLWWWCHI